MVIKIRATASEKRARKMRKSDEVGVLLFNGHIDGIGSLGASLLESVRYLPSMPSICAWDFLAISLAVYATDRFVSRRTAADGWTRELRLSVEVVDPTPWRRQQQRLQSILGFLTGDFWELEFFDRGVPVPEFTDRLNLSGRDCVCLFSGGLDSLIGAADLIHGGRTPILVSSAARIEIQYQNSLATALGVDGADHFSANVVERYDYGYEGSMRARSLLFLGLGAIAADALSSNNLPRVDLIIPENGFIALNPPLTLRRIGSLSTRTTHPHFLGSLQKLWNEVGLPIDLINPYRGMTKGEMIAQCKSPVAKRHFSSTYSCGKGKRKNGQCGTCIPCLIRRAAFRHAGIPDATEYVNNTAAAMRDSEDLFSARVAAARTDVDIARWVSATGPLPQSAAERRRHLGVARRGLSEIRELLKSFSWKKV